MSSDTKNPPIGDESLGNDTAGMTGTRVALVGKLAGMSKREAQQLLRQRGAIPVEPNQAPQLVVIGEQELPLGDANESWDSHARQLSGSGDAVVIRETQLWQRLGLVDAQRSVQRLYTPAMLADLLGVPVAVVRRWHRRGLIVPVRQVQRLPYFDFQEVSTARRLAELLASGMSPAAIERKLAEWQRVLPGIDRPLAQLSIIVQGRDLLLRQGEGLIDAGGQLRFDFDDSLAAESPAETVPFPTALSVGSGATTPEELCETAAALEDQGELELAAEAYRAAMAAGGPRAELCFLLAELLYRLNDLPAARERYYMAVELDEDYVEARANLGCVLAEAGQLDLAQAAFEGALRFHPDYPDAHYHLARVLEGLGTLDQARVHWETFLSLASDSPWAVHARERLSLLQPTSEVDES